MITFIRPRFALLGVLIALVAFGLTACSGDEPLAPTATNTMSDFPTDITQHPTYQAILDLDGGAELLAQLPAAEKWMCPPRARLFLVFENASFDVSEPPEFPEDSGVFFYDGFGVPLGHHTATGPYTVNYLTFEQYGTTEWTANDGDQIVADWSGTFTAPDEAGELTFQGGLEFTGGTGSFAGAIGSGGYFGDAATFAGEGRIVWYGWYVPGD